MTQEEGRAFSRRGVGVLALGMGGLGLGARAQVMPPNYPYVRMWATPRISVEIPRAWSLGSERQRISIEDRASMLLVGRLSDFPTVVLAAEHKVADLLQAWMLLRVETDTTLPNQDDARDLVADEILELDVLVRQQTDAAASHTGYRIARWVPTIKHYAGTGLCVLLTEYDANHPDPGRSFTSYITHVLAGGDTFILNCGHPPQQAGSMRNVIFRMINSLDLQT